MLANLAIEIGLNTLGLLLETPLLVILRSFMTTLSSSGLTKKRICEKAYPPREQQEQSNDEAATPNRCEADDSNYQEVGIPLTKLGEMENIKTGLRSFHVASEKKQPNGPRNKVKNFAEEDLLMILLAVFGLAKHRRHWGKRPEETWGVFLELLDDILTFKSETQVTYLQAGEWESLQHWVSGYVHTMMLLSLAEPRVIQKQPFRSAVLRNTLVL